MPATVEKIDVERVSVLPFPGAQLEKLWHWMQEFPKANFDDSRPADFETFSKQQMAAAMLGRKLLAVEVDGELVGAIGFQPGPLTGIGSFSGICFTRSVHGTDVALFALRALLAALWAEGYEKIAAAYFIDNRRVHHFLRKLGAVEKDVLKAETTRNGKPLDVRRVIIYRPAAAGPEEAV